MNKPIFKTKKEAIEESKCYDCKKKITIKDGEIKDGVFLLYEDEGEEFFAFKCDECYSKDAGLSEYKECEVYSRIVGYLRPVKQWNAGKKQEYEERKEYVVKND